MSTQTDRTRPVPGLCALCLHSRAAVRDHDADVFEAGAEGLSLKPLPDGSKIRIAGTPDINTRAAAEAAERDHIERAQSQKVAKSTEVYIFEKFVADKWWPTYPSPVNNRPSTVDRKRSTSGFTFCRLSGPRLVGEAVERAHLRLSGLLQRSVGVVARISDFRSGISAIVVAASSLPIRSTQTCPGWLNSRSSPSQPATSRIVSVPRRARCPAQDLGKSRPSVEARCSRTERRLQVRHPLAGPSSGLGQYRA